MAAGAFFLAILVQNRTIDKKEMCLIEKPTSRWPQAPFSGYVHSKLNNIVKIKNRHQEPVNCTQNTGVGGVSGTLLLIRGGYCAALGGSPPPPLGRKVKSYHGHAASNKALTSCKHLFYTLSMGGAKMAGKLSSFRSEARALDLALGKMVIYLATQEQ